MIWYDEALREIEEPRSALPALKIKDKPVGMEQVFHEENLPTGRRKPSNPIKPIFPNKYTK